MILKKFYKTLGQTELLVSPIGLGTVKFGRNQNVKYPTKFKIPDDKSVINLLTQARALGINLLDTAPAYGNSEERIGLLLPGQRSDWIIITKAGESFDGQKSHYCYTPEYLKKSLHNSLKNLKTDYMDVLLIHSDGNDLQIIEKFEVFDTLQRLKTQGLIRSFGMSTKTIEGGKKSLEFSDIIMMTLNPLFQEEISLLEYAHQLNKGILIKKGLASGHIPFKEEKNPIKNTFEFLFNHPIHSTIVGTINPVHLYENVQYATEAITTLEKN